MKIKDLKNECKVIITKDRFIVNYKNINLWGTIYPDLAECEIWLDEYKDGEYIEYSIIGKTKVLGFNWRN